MGLFESREEKQAREQREEERGRFDEERQLKAQDQQDQEEARLRQKWERVFPLVGRARAQEYFLDKEYRERYADEHRDDVLKRIAGEIEEQEMWLMDGEFTSGRLCNQSDVD